MAKGTQYSFQDLLHVLLKSVALRRSADKRTFPEDPRLLHRVFYRAQNLYGNQLRVLRELHFITAGAYPYSPELTEALDGLQVSDAVTRDNPSYERFRPTDYEDTGRVINRKRRALVGRDKAAGKALEHLIEELDNALRV